MPALLGQAPQRTDAWAPAARRVRGLVDFVRYLDPGFRRAQWLRDRRRAAVLDIPVLRSRDSLPRPVVRALTSALLAAERALPAGPEAVAFVREQAPDAVAVSPLVTGGSPQTDYVKAARALGIPSALCVASWDNLTNKGLARVVPDRVFVWNAAQRREAVELHRAPEDRVVVTGAQPFDRWFGRGPTATREAFCARVGLDPAKPIVLYVGSTSNIADPAAEDAFVRRWIAAVRRSEDPDVAGASLLIRPHPDRRGPWTTLDLAAEPDAVIWPPERPNSVTPAARGEYFDSLFHAAAIVGINTSAMVEGAIVDRPVLTVRLPELREAQDGTLHFDHLRPAAGGPLFEAPDLEAHARDIGRLLRDPAAASARNRAFVAAFIRPQGLDRPSAPLLVAGLEALPEAAVAREPVWPVLWLRPLLRVLAGSERRRAARDARPAPDVADGRRRARERAARLQAVADRRPVLAPALRAVAHALVVRAKRRDAAEKAARRRARETRARTKAVRTARIKRRTGA
jgi:hypothetical protein